MLDAGHFLQLSHFAVGRYLLLLGELHVADCLLLPLDDTQFCLPPRQPTLMEGTIQDAARQERPSEKLKHTEGLL